MDCSACDTFSLYFDEEVWEKIVEETNLYACQETMPNWQTLTVSEMKAYIGILVLMSIHNLPQVYLYWSSDKFCNVQEISNAMLLRHFQQITRCLYHNENSKVPDKTSPNFNRCYRLRPLMEMLNTNFQKEYKPAQANFTHQTRPVSGSGKFLPLLRQKACRTFGTTQSLVCGRNNLSHSPGTVPRITAIFIKRACPKNPPHSLKPGTAHWHS